MASPGQRRRRREARARKRKGGQNNGQPRNGLAALQANADVRVYTLSAVAKGIISYGTSEVSIGLSAFPNLSVALRGAVQWRVRSCRISWSSFDPGAKGQLGLYVSPIGNAWKPSDFHDLKTKGGSLRPVRNSDWSSNTMGAQDDWEDCSSPGGKLWLMWAGVGDMINEIGILTLHATVQVRGHRE
jgi:hypothetical protein